MARMSEIEWEPCLLTQKPAPDLERRFTRETGRPGIMMRWFEGSNWLSDVMVRISVQLMTFVHIDPNLVDQAGLVVSQDNSCRFCFGVQRAFMRVLGMSEKRIDQLEQDLLTGDFNEREKVALKFARQISQSKPLVTIEDIEPMRAIGFSDDEILEFAGLVGVHLFLNRMSTFVALPPQRMENFPDRWWVKLGRPLVAFKFRKMRHRRHKSALTDAEKSGPLHRVINAMDGLPMANEMRIMVDGLWQNSSLPARTVTLIFAVVGRALGSTQCEAEATKMLLEYGISEEDVKQVLAHLSSPVLSDTERLLLPLTRETVWYQPSKIQRRCADIQEQINHEEFLDFVGAVSLMNSLCRLGFLTEINQ